MHSDNNDNKSSEYNVTFTKDNFEGCSSFVVFTHKISFTKPEYGLSYNVVLYNGHDSDHKGEYVFGYYYPSDNNQVIKEVRTYYSVLSPKVPLVVSFIRGNTYNCYFSDLKNARWDYAYNIDSYSFRDNLSKDLLDDEFKKRSRNRKIQFTTNSDNIEVYGYPQDINNKLFRYIFIPKGDESVLGLNCLFDLDIDKRIPKSSHDPLKTNRQIDPYYLSTINGHFYDGIMVYFARENGNNKNNQKEYKGKTLLIEFYNSTKDKISIIRNDSNGAWWSPEKIYCNKLKTLISKLNDIEVKINKELSVIVILDEKRNYLGATVKTERDDNACKKYLYTFKKENNPKFIFARQIKKIGNFDNNFKTNTVEVYYLKVKDVEDKEPFVIVFFSSNSRVPIQKKAYHFANKYEFEGWIEFNFVFNNQVNVEAGQDREKDLVKKLEEKVENIVKFGSCIDNLDLLRWYAYRILISEDPTEEEITEKKTKRPPVITPKTETHLPIQWIIGGSVAGGVFVISSAALYGVYWYNTTIKLLT